MKLNGLSESTIWSVENLARHVSLAGSGRSLKDHEPALSEQVRNLVSTHSGHKMGKPLSAPFPPVILRILPRNKAPFLEHHVEHRRYRGSRCRVIVCWPIQGIQFLAVPPKRLFVFWPKLSKVLSRIFVSSRGILLGPGDLCSQSV